MSVSACAAQPASRAAWCACRYWPSAAATAAVGPVRNIGTETGANDDLAMVQAGSLTQPGGRRVRSLEQHLHRGRAAGAVPAHPRVAAQFVLAGLPFRAGQ